MVFPQNMRPRFTGILTKFYLRNRINQELTINKVTNYVYFSLVYVGVTKSFRTGCLERELQMVQLSATRCSCIAIL
jgi:hypothetical protein